MTASPEISVVIPCYNAERYVVAAVRSVLAQQFDRLEVIVVDDGSTDGSVDILRRACPQVAVVEQSNQGVGAARNAGIARAGGRWIAFLDADDQWLPGKLEAQRRLLELHPESRMCYSAWEVWHSTEIEPTSEWLAELRRRSDEPSRWSGASGWIYPELLLDCVVWTSTVLAHRSLFDEVGVFDASLRVGEDWDLWLRMSRATPVLRVCAPYAIYRMHAGSVTKRAPEYNYKAVVLSRAIERWGYGSADGRTASKAEVDRGLARSWSHYALVSLTAGDVRRARQGALTALRADPFDRLGWKVLSKTLLRAALARSAFEG